MVVAELQALVGDAVRRIRSSSRRRPSSRAGARCGRCDSGAGAIAVNGVGAFRRRSTRRRHRLGHRDMRLGVLEFLARRALEQIRSNTSRRRRRGRRRRAWLSARRPRWATCCPSPCPRSRPRAPRRGRSPAGCRRRSPADRRWTSRSDWRRDESSFLNLQRAGRPAPLRMLCARPTTSARSETAGTATSHQAPPASVDGDRVGVDDDHLRRLAPCALAAKALSSSAIEFDLDRLGAEAARMGDEIDLPAASRGARRAAGC